MENREAETDYENLKFKLRTPLRFSVFRFPPETITILIAQNIQGFIGDSCPQK
jgi:hypothetical protein